MDPTTFIFFVIIGLCLTGLWAKHWQLTVRVARLELQMGRFVSDVESEKETRRRSNRDLTNRIRLLEHQQPLPPNDCTKED